MAQILKNSDLENIILTSNNKDFNNLKIFCVLVMMISKNKIELFLSDYSQLCLLFLDKNYVNNLSVLSLSHLEMIQTLQYVEKLL